jgi:hypothetical protein
MPERSARKPRSLRSQATAANMITSASLANSRPSAAQRCGYIMKLRSLSITTKSVGARSTWRSARGAVAEAARPWTKEISMADGLTPKPPGRVRGRPVEKGRSGHPNGRRIGCRNKTTIAAAMKAVTSDSSLCRNRARSHNPRLDQCCAFFQTAAGRLGG